MIRSGPPTLMLCWVLVIQMGCDPELPPERVRSEGVRYHSSTEGLGDAFAAELDGRYDALAERLGVRPGPIHYYHLDDVEDLRCLCDWEGAGAHSGCTVGHADIFALEPIHGHELVHPFGHALGHPPRVFVEGLAMVLGGGRWGDAVLPKDDRIADLLDDDYFLHAGSTVVAKHGAAMSLVAYLVDRYGWPWLIELYREMPRDAGAAGDWLEDATGSSLADLTEAWRASPAGSTGVDSVENLYECGPTLEPFELNAEQNVELALGVAPAPGTTHFAGGALRSFAIEGDSLLRWARIDSGAPGLAQLSACEGAAHRDFTIDSGVEVWNDVRPGRYWLGLYFQDGSTGDMTAKVAPMEPFVGGDCAALTPAGPSASHETVIDYSPEHTVRAFDCVDGACTGWLRLTTAEALDVRVRRILSEGESLRWTALSRCEGCAGTCTELEVYERDPADPLVLSPTDGELTLRIELDESLAARAGLMLGLVPVP